MTTTYKGRAGFLLGGIVLLGSLLRFLLLSHKSLWTGETFSVWTARLDWTHFLIVLSEEPYMMLYYVLLRFWLVLGDTEVAIRSLTATFSVATIPLLYALGARLFGRRVGLIGALLLAVNAFHIAQAQNARSYSLLVFFVTASSFFFVKSIEQPTTPRHWIGYVLSSALSVYSHAFAALVLLAQCASLICLSRRDVPWKKLAWSLLSIGFLLLPLAVVVLMGGANRFTWISEPSLYTVLRTFSALAGAGGPFLLAIYLLCCLITPVQAIGAKSSITIPGGLWRYGFLLLWLFLPFILTLAGSVLTPALSVRYMIICLPPTVLLAAVGIARLRSLWMVAVTICIVVSFASYGIYKYHRHPNYDWRSATSHIISKAQRHDAALFYWREDVISFDYYRQRFNGFSDRPTVVFPPPSQTHYSMFFTNEVRKVPPGGVLLDDLPSRYRRVWLITTWEDSATVQTIRESLARHYHTVEKIEFPGVTVFLYSQRQVEGPTSLRTV